MSQSTDITFEGGYRRLQDIAERLSSDEVPVHEMCDLFAEGKGLEQALAGYLAEQKARVEAIERGEGMRAFRVVPPGDEAAATVGAAAEAGSPTPPGITASRVDGAEVSGGAPSGRADAPGSAASRAAAAPRDGDGGAAPGPLDEPLPF